METDELAKIIAVAEHQVSITRHGGDGTMALHLIVRLAREVQLLRALLPHPQHEAQHRHG